MPLLARENPSEFFGSIYYTIKDDEFLRLNDSAKKDFVDAEGLDSDGKFGVLYYDLSGQATTFEGKFADQEEAENRAIEVVKDGGERSFRTSKVVLGEDKTFLGRPVFLTIAVYHFITKEEEEEEDESLQKAALTSAQRNNLPDSMFGFIESGGKKDKSGKTMPRSKRHFPLDTAARVRNALARIAQGAKWGKQALPKVLRFAKKFGIKATVKKVEKEVEIVKSELSKGLVYGIVYSPGEKDTHGDFTSAEEIEKAAQEFLPRHIMDLGHASNLKKGTDFDIVESYLAPCDFVLNGNEVKCGAWIMVTKVKNPTLKKMIEKGTITGYSLEGLAMKIK